MRVNQQTPAYKHVAIKTDKATGDAKRLYGGRGAGNYALPKHPLAATPLVTNQLKNPDTYKPGDGDYFHQPQRAGSCHKHIKSRGF